MHDALRSLGAIDRFQFFVLSDSTDEEKAHAEKLAWARLVPSSRGPNRIFYRRRKLPLNRKSGNIADFCRRWGSQYRYMICLDADSLMSAAPWSNSLGEWKPIIASAFCRPSRRPSMA